VVIVFLKFTEDFFPGRLRGAASESLDDLPECEREEVIRARLTSNDRLQYEIRNTEIYRDGWRLFTKESVRQILYPRFGKVSVC
jgi:hypothetical protein